MKVKTRLSFPFGGKIPYNKDTYKKNSMGSMGQVPANDMLEFGKGGKSGIHIKKENRGKFTASAKRAGHSVQQHARSVLANPNATPLQKKRANFARNAAKWKHAKGGKLPKYQTGGEITEEELIKRELNNNNDYYTGDIAKQLEKLGVLERRTFTRDDYNKIAQYTAGGDEFEIFGPEGSNHPILSGLAIFQDIRKQFASDPSVRSVTYNRLDPTKIPKDATVMGFGPNASPSTFFNDVMVAREHYDEQPLERLAPSIDVPRLTSALINLQGAEPEKSRFIPDSTKVNSDLGFRYKTNRPAKGSINPRNRGLNNFFNAIFGGQSR